MKVLLCKLSILVADGKTHAQSSKYLKARISNCSGNCVQGKTRSAFCEYDNVTARPWISIGFRVHPLQRTQTSSNSLVEKIYFFHKFSKGIALKRAELQGSHDKGVYISA